MDRRFAPLYDKSVRRIAFAAVFAFASTGALAQKLAQNGTVAFSGHVGRNEPLTIVVFTDRALLPLPERAGKITLTNEGGEPVAFDTVRYGGDYASIEISSAGRQEFRLCAGPICRRYEVVRVGANGVHQ